MERERELGLRYLELEKFIKLEPVREMVETALVIFVPLEFFTQPASSSGKYHPEYALGERGLLRHTKAAMVIAKELFVIHDFDLRTRSIIMAALVLHDTKKPSKTHPIEVGNMLDSLITRFEFLNEVLILIDTHMGQWNEGVLPIPHTKEQKFVHMCDYLASRKCITVDVQESAHLQK